MADTDGQLRREWDAAEAQWRAATTPGQRGAAEQKFIKLEKRWTVLQEKKRFGLTDPTRLREICAVADDYARLTEFPVFFTNGAVRGIRGRPDNDQSLREVLWTVSMRYDGDRAAFDEARWDKLIGRINEQLRRLSYIAWDQCGDHWTYMEDEVPQEILDDETLEFVPREYLRKVYTWAFEKDDWPLPPRPR